MNPTRPTIKTEILPVLMLVASFIIGAYFYSHFSARVASHWNFQGQVDGYSGKFFPSFGIPLILLGMYALFMVLPYVDPKKDRYEEFLKPYHIFKNILITILFALFLATGLYNLGYAINIGYIAPLLIGLIMVVLGNYMGKLKPNWFMGIRTPWTLSSETVWQKTHRVGGFLFVVFGLILMLMPFLGKTFGLILFVAGLVGIIFGTTIYSYVLYRREKANSLQ